MSPPEPNYLEPHAATEYLGSTTSLCRVCRRLIPARLFVEPDGVWFHKHCPEHGPQAVRVSSDAAAYLRLGRFHRRASQPLAFATKDQGCPASCGLCPQHEQHVCLPILEITDHCDLDCPICLVHNPGTRHLTRLEVARMLDGLILSEGQIDVLNLSGGEPTLHPEFREIVAECVSRPEILRVSVSTNGRRLARDTDLVRFLADQQVIISLQFDARAEEVYERLRGRPLLGEKLRLIEQCAQLDAPMSLTTTVVHGVNDTGVGEIVDLLFQQPNILSAMFQPAAYAGKAAQLERPTQAVTIPDVIRALHGSAGETVSADDFSPLPCSHPACFALAFYLQVEDGQFLSIKQMLHTERYLDIIQNRAIFGTDAESFERITEAVYELWSGPAALSPDSQKALRAVKRLLAQVTAGNGYSPHQALAVAERSIKSIFIHAFMDPESFDLSRARKCCQVYPQPDGRLIPACVHNCLLRSRS